MVYKNFISGWWVLMLSRGTAKIAMAYPRQQRANSLDVVHFSLQLPGLKIPINSSLRLESTIATTVLRQMWHYQVLLHLDVFILPCCASPGSPLSWGLFRVCMIWNRWDPSTHTVPVFCIRCPRQSWPKLSDCFFVIQAVVYNIYFYMWINLRCSEDLGSSSWCLISPSTL